MNWPEQNTMMSLASLTVAISAVIIAYIAPIKSVGLSERLRNESAEKEEKQRNKKWVFTTLMLERAFPYTQQAVQALNVIDVAFIDSKPVRDAWAQYFTSLDPQRGVHYSTQHQYFIELLMRMAEDIGYTDLRYTDISRIYSPKYLTKKHSVENMQLDLAEADLIKMSASLSANTTPNNMNP